MRTAALLVAWLSVVTGGVSGCEKTKDGASAAPAASTPETVTPPPPLTPGPPAASGSAAPPDPPPALVKALTAAERAIGGGDFPGADRALDSAAAATGGDPHFGYVVAIYRATRFAYAGDFGRAAQALTAAVPELAKHPELPDEFSAHNQMMMLRVAQGDPAAALAEDDQATAAAARGTWAPGDREILAFLKDRWHRAYLSRMLAETRKGAARQALVRDAEAALDEYRARARQLGTNEDSIAVLEAYFAALDGKSDAALRAARRVDLAKDDDIEDLYLVVVGLEAGGDHARAERVRRKMRQPGEVHLSRPIMLRWLDLDAKVPRDKGFTPWHPT